MEFKFAPGLLGRSAAPKSSESPTSHAIAGSSGALVGQYGSVFDPARNGWDVEEAVRRGLERVIWVYRCVDAIALNQAKLSMVVRKEDPYEGEVTKNPALHKLLNIRPNTYEDAFQFRYRLSGQLLLSKRGVFIEMKKDAFGIPVELHLLPPHRVEPIPDPKTFVSGYWLSNMNNSKEWLPRENVIWLRTKPHPVDPYAQLNPLAAAQLAIDTDWLSRLFNRNFLLNDGRPGMLIAVAGKMSPTTADKIQARFSGGVQRAGEVSVIEGENLNVVDFGSTPRDVQWLEGLTGSKNDILLAFGTPESVLGNASGRTFDNADAEKGIWWEETEQPHCDGIGRGLDVLTGSVTDDLFVSHDYSKVPVLQRHKELKEQKLREKFQAGLCTVDEYMEETGRKPWNVPATRVLYLGNGVTVARNEEDQAAVTAIKPLTAAGPAQPVDPAQAAQQGALEGVRKGQRSFENIVAARAIELSRINTTRAYAMANEKALPSVVESKTDDDYADDFHPYEVVRASAEGAFEGILHAWTSHQGERLSERMDHSKVRRGTRHWEGDPGTKALDASYIVNEEQWAADLGKSMSAMMRRLATQTVNHTARGMDQQGILSVMGAPSGRSRAVRVYGTTQDLEKSLSDLLEPLDDVVTMAAKTQMQRIKERIAEMDAQGASLTAIKKEVAKMSSKNSQWRTQLAKYLTTAIIEGAQYKTYEQAGALIDKTWNTVEDERVRHTHKVIDGTTKPIKRKFKVGKSWMRYPCAPEGAIEEKAGCRCWVGYSINEAAADRYDQLAS